MVATDYDPRESDKQRLARNLHELLQGLRVLQAGVQFLFGSLLALAFTEVYPRVSAFERTVHLVAVSFATIAIALLTAPAAWHRLLFGRGQRPLIIHVAHNLTLVGMVCLLLATAATLLFLVTVAVNAVVGAVVTVVTAALFALLWYVVPVHAIRE